MVKKDLNNLSFDELQKEVEALGKRKSEVTVERKGVWEVGQNYVIRTVTMIQVGKLVDVQPDELVLESAAWVADTGRYADFLSSGKVSEVEPFPEGQVIVGRHAVIDACVWKHGLLRSQK